MKSLDRSEIMQYKVKSNNNRVAFVVTHHPELPKLQSIVRKHWDILGTSDRLQQAFPNEPVIAYRRPKNLKDLLVRAKVDLPPKVNGSSKQSVKPRCKVCLSIQQTNTFVSSVTSRKYIIRQQIDCSTENVVYLLECKKCKIQYVGENKNELRLRFNQLKYSIRSNAVEFPVAAHFNKEGHTLEDISVVGIDHCHSWSDEKSKSKENFWILQLRTKQSSGLNLAV